MNYDIYTQHSGTTPLIVSIPHDGRLVPDDITSRMTDAGRAIPDTDWHVAKLYGFARTLGASVIAARYSRYVVDLNRPADDGILYEKCISTGLCPERTFAGDAIYIDGTITRAERQARVARYWQPYHDALAAELLTVQARHGYALLWDAHSITSTVPALFDGQLPVLNLGTWHGRSCAKGIEDSLAAVVAGMPYPAVVNGRFTGGYITRQYGKPDAQVHAVQLELAQRAYMDEKTLRYDAALGATLMPHLQRLLQAFLASADALYR